MLKHFGANIDTKGTTAFITPEPSLFAREICVPGDISSAAYFIAAGLLTPNSEILLKNVGINPTNDGRCLRLVFPQLTEERRKELCKTVSKDCEDGKVAVRNVRRDANDAIKKAAKGNEISEDEQKQIEDEIQKMTDKFVTEIDKATDAKTTEIMTV